MVNITKEMFCNFLTEIVNQFEKRDAMFDKIDGFINFEPFFDTDFYHLAIKGLAMAYNPIQTSYVADVIEWWLERYIEGHPQDAIVANADGKEYCLYEMGDLYDYLTMIYV